MNKMKLTVTVDDAHIDQTEKVAESLTKAGFTVESTMPELGAIFGSATADSAADLQGVEGVLEVRESGTIQLPPLDESTPQ